MIRCGRRTVGAVVLSLCLLVLQGEASAEAAASTTAQAAPAAPAAPAPAPVPGSPATAAPSGPPLTLQAAVQEALARNPQVASAQQAVVAAQANVVTARTGLEPSIGLAGTAGLGNTGGQTSVSQGLVGGFGSPTATGALSISGSLPLYDSGKTPAAVAQAEATVVLAQATLKQTQQDIALQAATDFFNVLAAERLTSVREAQLKQFQQQLEQTQAQFRAGTAAQADVIQAQAQVATAEVNLLTAQNQVDTSKAALQSVLAADVQTPVEVQEPPAPPTTVTMTADAALQEALQNRSEIAEGVATVQANQAALTLANIEAGVQVSIGLSAGYVPFSTNNFANNSTSYGLTGTVSLPVFDSGKGKAGIDAAKANLSAAQAKLDQTRLAIRQDAYQSYLAVVQGAANVTATAAAQAAADAALRVAEGRYRAGVATIVEVTTSAANAAQAEVNAVSAVYTYETALATLDHAMGRPVSASVNR